ncbi:MAG: GlsB/YeaQ/YmgE family stress response membrane protein [Alphaproteobacteria bacterium]|nr:GlsB/YeaQ/YmgE family stress response membrane protein [Alphaproteobacteria bacterium]
MIGYGWIMTILIGGLAGWIAEKVMKFDTGLILNIILGIVGAMVGNFILQTVMGATFGGFIGQLAVAVGGACLLIFAYKTVKNKA